METMCLNSGISGIVPSISITGSLDSRTATNPSQVKPPQNSSVFSRFSFRYPLESLWPRPRGGTGNSRYNGLALDDAVLAENKEGTKAFQEENEEEEGQNGNWVLKILHVRSAWKRKQENGDGNEEEKEGEKGVVNDNEDEEVVCDSCRVDNDNEENDEEGENVQFDRDSFSRMLRKVSLAEARLYAQMSHLGNLAYSIPTIKVYMNHNEIFLFFFFFFFSLFFN